MIRDKDHKPIVVEMRQWNCKSPPVGGGGGTLPHILDETEFHSVKDRYGKHFDCGDPILTY